MDLLEKALSKEKKEPEKEPVKDVDKAIDFDKITKKKEPEKKPDSKPLEPSKSNGVLDVLKEWHDNIETPEKKESSGLELGGFDEGKTEPEKPTDDFKFDEPKETKITQSRIIGLIGKQGVGKSSHSASFGKLGKVLYLDSEQKAHIVINEHFNKYNIEVISFRQVDNRGRIDKLKTVKYFEKMIPTWLDKLKNGNYAVCVIDKCSLFRPYAKYEWLRQNPNRTKPQSYEWGEIEEIVQDLLYPFITTCRDNNIHLILTYDIKDKYLENTVVGYEEDAKTWILGEMDIEIWMEWDYQMYCLKHPYKPFWSFRTEGVYLVDYFDNKEFIDKEVTFKEYQSFMEETLMSANKKKEVKERSSKISLI